MQLQSGRMLEEGIVVRRYTSFLGGQAVVLVCAVVMLMVLIAVMAGYIFSSQREAKALPELAQTSELALKLYPSILRVESLSHESKVLKVGTGFFVSENGIVATCAHVIEGATLIRVTTLNGAEFQFKSVLKKDVKKDIAFIQIAAAGAAALNVRTGKAEVGERVAVMANPLGLNGSFSTGVISAFRTAEADVPALVQISVPVSPGSSGAPVIDMKGKLVAMVTSKIEAGEAVGFAVPAEIISEALSQISKEEPPSSNKSIASAFLRYVPSKNLNDDPDWNHGNLPNVKSQRLALLRQLSARYPDECVIDLEIGNGLLDDGDKVSALRQFSQILSKDPANRLALEGLSRSTNKDELLNDFVRAAIFEDPLDFRARLKLVDLKESEKDYNGAFLDSFDLVETAPYFLPAIEKVIDCHLDLLFHEPDMVGEWEDFENRSVSISDAILQANSLRLLIAKGATILSAPNEVSMEAFTLASEADPERSFPYCRELIFTAHSRRSELKQLFRSSAGLRLREIVKQIVADKPLLCNSYLSDYAATDYYEGILIETARTSWVKSRVSVGCPHRFFDYWAISWLLNKNKSEVNVGLAPESLLKWQSAMSEHYVTEKLLGDAASEIFDYTKSEVSPPVLFNFVMACEKERIQSEAEKETNIKRKGELTATLEALREIPSKSKAAEDVRVYTASGNGIFWRYYETNRAWKIRQAFEDLAR